MDGNANAQGGMSGSLLWQRLSYLLAFGLSVARRAWTLGYWTWVAVKGTNPAVDPVSVTQRVDHRIAGVSPTHLGPTASHVTDGNEKLNSLVMFLVQKHLNCVDKTGKVINGSTRGQDILKQRPVRNRRIARGKRGQMLGRKNTSRQTLQAISTMNIMMETMKRTMANSLVVPLNNELRPIPSAPSLVLMVIHRPEEKIVQQVAKLDNGSAENLITRRFASSLGLQVSDYFGPQLRVIGSLFLPGGVVSFNWHASGKKRIYTTTFLVLEEHQSQGLNFDILLSGDEIDKVGFYAKNTWVFSVIRSNGQLP
ncbi:MAG: hypothetical protein Q9181_004884 [Wetmoreana brouardii]